MILENEVAWLAVIVFNHDRGVPIEIFDLPVQFVKHGTKCCDSTVKFAWERIGRHLVDLAILGGAEILKRQVSDGLSGNETKLNWLDCRCCKRRRQRNIRWVQESSAGGGLQVGDKLPLATGGTMNIVSS